MSHDGAHLTMFGQQRDRLWTGETHADETTEMVLAPRVAVEQQHVPATPRHQVEKFLLTLGIQLQHGPFTVSPCRKIPDFNERNQSARSQHPQQGTATERRALQALAGGEVLERRRLDVDARLHRHR